MCFVVERAAPYDKADLALAPERVVDGVYVAVAHPAVCYLVEHSVVDCRSDPPLDKLAVEWSQPLGEDGLPLMVKEACAVVGEKRVVAQACSELVLALEKPVR
jgi:hypothetical protein